MVYSDTWEREEIEGVNRLVKRRKLDEIATQCDALAIRLNAISARRNKKKK